MTDTSARDDRLLDLARRLLDGEAIDWAAEGIEEAEVRKGMQRLQPMLRIADDTERGKVVVEKAGDRFIGDFRLVRKLGEGGMGVVYEAEQQHPRRPVALKVIRGGHLVDDHTLRLFQREIQTLARLSHPGIAQLYEAGVTVDGMHFFAMELIRGEPLSEWLKKRSGAPVTPEEIRLRLGVFRKICDAVAYAHQKGVIHRDLKPGNILIPKAKAGSSTPDAVPEVKILDFGLARMTDTDVQMTTHVTEMGRVQGTLPYMSPEQVRGNPDEIDLRTDVYSLGVLLYEIVTGRLPYDFSKAQLPDAVRMICEEAPKSISTTFSGTHRLDADVITIAGKCLEKEASRRYQSAAVLGEDVQRYLTDQPILARPPSTAYQFRKMVRRHKGPFAAAASVFVLLIVFSIAMTVQAVRIGEERDRANHEAETARRVSHFLEGLFRVSDPSETRGQTVTAREILDAGADKIDRDLRNQPAIQARLMQVIGEVQCGLGLMREAQPLVENALRIYEAQENPPGPGVANALNLLGVIDWALGQHARALDRQRRALAIYERVLPAGDPKLARAVYLVGTGLCYTGDWVEAESVLLRAVQLADSEAVPRPGLRIAIRDDLGYLHLAADRYVEAERWYREALDLATRELPEDDPEILNALNNVGFALGLQGRHDEGRAYLERALAGAERVYGPVHPNTANMLHSLGELERRAGRFDRAREHLDRALLVAERSDGPDSQLAAMVLTSLAPTLADSGRFAEAEAAYRRLVAIWQKNGNDESREMAETLEGLARVLARDGRPAEAAPLERRARELRQSVGKGVGLAFQSGHGYSIYRF